MTAIQRALQPDGYVLERNDAEAARLRDQARVLEAATERMLRAAGLEPGMRCLDAGCGTGEGMRICGRIVGHAGHVTGLDIDPATGRRALAAMLAEEGPQFAFVAGDITRGDPVPGAPFDMVFARLLLLHMADPVGTVGRLAALVRPGGRLVLVDYDMGRLAVRPEHPAFDRAFQILTECFRRSGKDIETGLRLAQHVIAAGLPEPEGWDYVPSFGPVGVEGHRLVDVLASLVPAAQALGIAPPDEIEPLRAELRAVVAAGKRMMICPTLIGVWTTIPHGQRP